MITRFEVDGFKSLRNFAVDLSPLTVFVGPNGAGKSNLLEAMALLGRLASMPVEEAFKKGRGRILDQFGRFGGETSRTIRFGVELALPITDTVQGVSLPPTRSRYELCVERRALDSGIEELIFADEILRANPGSAGGAQGELLLCQQSVGKGQRQVFVADRRSITGMANWLLHSSHTALMFGRDDVQTAPEAAIRAVAAELGSFRYLHLDATRLRENVEKISSGVLAADASNLAAVLADLPAPVLGSIRADLVSLVPGLAGFEVVPEGDTLRLDFELSGGELLPARLASDGTLRALALLTALTMTPSSSILGIEELENGIYPGRLRKLLSLLRESSDADPAAQIVLTTHSPVVVAAFRDKPELLRMVDVVVRDGKRETRVRPVGKPKKPSDSAFIASLREVDALLEAADAEAAE